MSAASPAAAGARAPGPTPAGPARLSCPHTRASSPHSSPRCSSATSRSSSGSTTPTIACTTPTNSSGQDSRPARSRHHPRRRRGAAIGTSPIAALIRDGRPAANSRCSRLCNRSTGRSIAPSAPTNMPRAAPTTRGRRRRALPTAHPERCAPPAGARDQARQRQRAPTRLPQSSTARSTRIVATTPPSGQPERLLVATPSRSQQAITNDALHR